MDAIVSFVSILLLLAVVTVNCQDSEKVLRWKERVLRNYDKTVRPSNSSGPLIVRTYLQILQVEFNDITKDVSVTMYLRRLWKDARLASNDNSMRTVRLPKDQVWLPDVFFRNLRSGSSFTVPSPHYLLRIEPDGSILYSEKLQLTFLSANMIGSYPVDSYLCKIDMGLYSYRQSEVSLIWRSSTPANLAKDANEQAGFVMDENIDVQDCSASYTTSTGAYSCLQLFFYLERRSIAAPVITYYVPSCFLVAISWLPFWLHPKAMVAKFLLGLFAFTVILCQLIVVNVTGVTALSFTLLHLWLFLCSLFPLFSLLEVILVEFLNRRRKRGDDSHEHTDQPHILDKVSRILFPVLFVIFIIAYWCGIMSSSD